MDIKVTTQAGGVFIIRDASAFGSNAIIGHTDSNPDTKIFEISEDDKLEKLS